MENVKRTLKINRIGGQNVWATLKTEWDVKGEWFERGRLMSGLIGKSSRETVSFFSVVEAQNYADKVGARFFGMRA